MTKPFLKAASITLLLSACNLYNPYDGTLPTPETPPATDSGSPAPTPPPVVVKGDCSEDPTVTHCMALKLVTYRNGGLDPTL